MSEAGREMAAPGTQGPSSQATRIVAPASFVWSSGAIAYRNLLHNNPSISLCVPHVRGRGEMQGPGMGPLVKLLVEGFHSPACIRLVEWRDRKSIVTLTTTNPSISLPRMSEGPE
jgi:hypothetical protein